MKNEIIKCRPSFCRINLMLRSQFPPKQLMPLKSYSMKELFQRLYRILFDLSIVPLSLYSSVRLSVLSICYFHFQGFKDSADVLSNSYTHSFTEKLCSSFLNSWPNLLLPGQYNNKNKIRTKCGQMYIELKYD